MIHQRIEGHGQGQAQDDTHRSWGWIHIGNVGRCHLAGSSESLRESVVGLILLAGTDAESGGRGGRSDLGAFPGEYDSGFSQLLLSELLFFFIGRDDDHQGAGRVDRDISFAAGICYLDLLLAGALDFETVFMLVGHIDENTLDEGLTETHLLGLAGDHADRGMNVDGESAALPDFLG